MAEDTSWARAAAAALLVALGRRWTHTLGVVERAQSFAYLLPDAELEVLVASAYLHDIGYSFALVRTGFHPLDGAWFLRRLGRERLACLVASESDRNGRSRSFQLPNTDNPPLRARRRDEQLRQRREAAA